MFLKCLGFCRLKHTSSTAKQYPTIIEELCHQFSLVDLRKSTNNFDKKRVIYHGAFGVKVYKGCLQHNGDSDYTVAIKRFNAEGRWDLFNNEIELLCQLHHPNIISLIGFCNDENEKILLFEYMSNGSLDQHLQGGELSWTKRLEICIGTARGLHYLHTGTKRIIFHRDIDLKNILLNDDMEPKLSDFRFCLQGALSISKPKPIQVDSIMGTSGFMAMEYAMYGTVTDKCDVYSFGKVLLDIVCGGKYVNKEAETEFLEKPVEEKIDLKIKGKIAPKCWELFIDIIVRCVKQMSDQQWEKLRWNSSMFCRCRNRQI